MRRYFGLFVISVTVLAACVAREAKAASIAEALPPDVLAYIDIPSVPALLSTDADTGYNRIMSEPQMRAFLTNGFPALGDANKMITSAAGRGWPEILQLCKGEVALAVIKTADPDSAVSAALVVSVGSDQAAAKEFVSQAAGRIGSDWHNEDIPGTTASYAQLPSGIVAYAFAGDYLVVATSLDTLKTVTKGLQSGQSPNLAGDAAYVRSLALAHAEQPEMVVYANVDLFSKMLLPHLGERGTKVYDDLGFGSVTSVIYSSRQVGAGYVDRVVVYCPNGRKGLLASLSPGEGDYQKYMSMVPANVMSCAWTHMDFAAIYDTLANAIKPEAGEGDAQDPLAKVQADTGIDVRADIVGSLGKNVITYSSRPTALLGLALAGGMAQSVTLVELTDPARLQTALDKAWVYAASRRSSSAVESSAAVESSGPQVPPQESAAGEGPDVAFAVEPFGDKTIYKMTVALGQRVPIQLTPAFAIRDKWLVFSMQAQNVKNVISAPTIGAAAPAQAAGTGATVQAPPNVLSNSDYVAAARIAGPANAGASYLDSKSLFETLYSIVGIGLPILSSSLGGQMPIEPAFMPEPTAISSHLAGGATSVNVQDDAIEFTSYGVIGDARILYMTAASGAALGAWYVQAQQGHQAVRPRGAATEEQPTKEETTKSELATIGRGLLLYARSHDGAFPQDLKTLADSGALKDESGDVSVNVADYVYVPGLALKADSRLILVFARQEGAGGRGVLLVNMNVMDLSDAEVAEQAGGWLGLPNNPSAGDMEAACKENLVQLAASVKRYAESHDGMTPVALDWATSYRFAPLVTSCPADAKKDGPDYAVVGRLNLSAVPDDKKAETVIAYETKARHDGKAGVAFLDGSFKFVTEAELATLVANTRALAQSLPTT